MAGYIPFETLRPILHRGPVPMPVVDIRLVRPQVAEPVQSASPVRRVNDRRRKSEAVIAEIIRMREAGEPYSAIHAALGVSSGTINRYAAHVAPPGDGWNIGGRKAVMWNKPMAERLRRAGFSYREIGENIGCCGATALDLLKGRKDRSTTKTPIGRLIRAVTRGTGVRASEIRKPRPGRVGCMLPDVCRARAILFWIARHKFGDMTLTAIGREVGGFHHSSVLMGIGRVAGLPGIGLIDVSKPPAAIARRLWSLDWSGARQ